MPTISLTTFVDFVAVAGPRRVPLVRECKFNNNQPYDPRKDFYKRLRESVVAFEKGSMTRAQFEDIESWGVAEKKTANFEDAVTHYLSWRDSVQGCWSEPVTGHRVFGELRIRVNPEVGLNISGQRHSVKLHFKRDNIPANRMTIIQGLMGSLANAGVSSILDIRREAYFSRTDVEGDVNILLAAEAAAFMAIWNSV